MLAAGCSASPSSNAQPSLAASNVPMADLPLADTPAMIMIIDARPLSGSLPSTLPVDLRHLLASRRGDRCGASAHGGQNAGARGRRRPGHRDPVAARLDPGW